MTRKKEFQTPEYIGSGRVGLMIFRGQPWHRGHDALFSLMRQDCDTMILAFGSTQLSHQIGHPFTFEHRLNMVRSLHGDVFKAIQLVDIDSSVSNNDWISYVIQKIQSLNLPEPTDYYTGSEFDAKWYTEYFASLNDPHNTIGPVTTYKSKKTGKRLNLLNRDQTPFPPAQELRSLIERRDDAWKPFVPARIVDYIEWHYPPHLRTAIPVKDLPDPKKYIEGTRVVIENNNRREVFETNGKEWFSV